MSSVVIDKTFEAVLNRLQQYAGAASLGMQSGGSMPWCGLNVDNVVVDGFDHDAISVVFARSALAKAYTEALTPGQPSYRNAQIAKLQNDTLSAVERDTRMRHRSRVRMIAHAISRSATHGLATGPIGGNMFQYVKTLVSSGTV